MTDSNEAPDGGKRTAKLEVAVSADLLAKTRQAAILCGRTLDEFVTSTVEREADRVLRDRKGLLDISAAAEYLGVTRKVVVEMITAGKLRARKIEGEWLVEQESAKELEAATPRDESGQIELDLEELVTSNGLSDIDTSGPAPPDLALSWCYVNQQGVLHCPRAAWARLGRQAVVAAARDAIARFVRRRARESGKV